MKVLLAPAKKMIMDDDGIAANALPMYLERTKVLLERLRSLSLEDLAKTWKCSDALVKVNTERLETMDLEGRLTPAVFAYVGLAYQHLCPGGMNDEEIAWLQKHLRILSGFYGILRPLDGTVPYRLEMQARMPGYEDLYTFWGSRLYDALNDHVIVDLASKEYSHSIVPYLKPDDRYIEIVFAEEKNGKLITKGTMAKMARGEMVSWMAQNGIEDPEDIKAFERGYVYSSAHSREDAFVFLRKDGRQ